MFMRSPYNYNVDAASEAAGLACEEPSLTQQHFADECDINTILRRFNITGQLPEAPLSPRYGDFSGIGDYHSCLNAVLLATEQFEALPAAIRARFGNDPAELIEFLDNADNRSEAIELGLLDRSSDLGSSNSELPNAEAPKEPTPSTVNPT